eukprot:3413198-Alexandrium_andersonii.AAC.1
MTSATASRAASPGVFAHRARVLRLLGVDPAAAPGAAHGARCGDPKGPRAGETGTASPSCRGCSGAAALGSSLASAVLLAGVRRSCAGVACFLCGWDVPGVGSEGSGLRWLGVAAAALGRLPLG